MSKLKKAGKAWKYIIIFVLLLVLGNSVVICRENEYKLIRQFGKVQRVVSASGLAFKVPFIQSVDTVPKEILIYDLPASDVITSDKKSMITLQLCAVAGGGSPEVYPDPGQFCLQCGEPHQCHCVQCHEKYSVQYDPG